MATSIELQPTPSGQKRQDPSQSISKKRKRSPALSLDYGIATPPKSPSPSSHSFPEIEKSSSRVSGTVQPLSPPTSPEPSTPSPDASTNLLTLIRELKAGNSLLEDDLTFSIAPTEFSHFENALREDRRLETFFRKLRWDWDRVQGLFRFLGRDVRAERVRDRVLKRLETWFGELANSERMAEAQHTLGGLDSWERKRVKELVELIRPLPSRTSKIGQGRLSPDLAFTFGTTDSLLGLAQVNKDPLVVFEVRQSTARDVRHEMEERARCYLEERRFENPFRPCVKTVVLVYYTQGDEEVKDVQIAVSRAQVVSGTNVITTQVSDPLSPTPPGVIEVSLSDFLPQDAIELGFRENEDGTRACDSVKIAIEIADIVWHTNRPGRDHSKAGGTFPPP